MTMSVSTPLAPVAVGVDAGSAAPTGGVTGDAAGEFSDALAGFLDNGPVVTGEQADSDSATAGEGESATPVVVDAATALASPATAAPLTAAVAMLGYTRIPAVQAAAGAGLATEAVLGVTAPAAGATGAVTGTDMAVTGTDIAGHPGAPVLSSAPTPAQPLAYGAAGSLAALAAPPGDADPAPLVASLTNGTVTDTAAQALSDTEPVDAQAAARALGLTLTTPRPPLSAERPPHCLSTPLNQHRVLVYPLRPLPV